MHLKNIAKNLLVFLTLNASSIVSANAGSFIFQQALFDDVNNIDGLDNPRQVKLSPNGKHVWVTSADDNSVLILELDEGLTPVQLFKNEEEVDTGVALKLEGANGLALTPSGAFIASFYDSALSTFKIVNDLKYAHSGTETDNLSYQRVFQSDEPPSEMDKLGILGAWGLEVSESEKQLFVASYKSDALSIFDIDEDSQLSFVSKVTSQDLSQSELGRPVSLAYSEANNELVVAGYEGNILTVFSKGEHGKLSVKQTIYNDENAVEHLVNPQYVILSSDSRFMYVACSGSNTILVFERTDEKYTFLQSVTHSETHGSGLAGVASLAISTDGLTLYAAGEFDKGVLRFDISDNGSLILKETIQSDDNEIEGVTSIALSEDGQHMLLSLGKKDALYLLKHSE